MNNPIIIPVDELVHTDESPVCSDVTCPCHGDRLKGFNKAAGIDHNDAQGLGHGPYIVEIDSKTKEVTIYGANELVPLTPQEARYLLDFLYKHRDEIREAAGIEEPSTIVYNAECVSCGRVCTLTNNGICEGCRVAAMYPETEF